MIETLHPILPKTAVLGLLCHVGRSGLCIGDPAQLVLSDSGEVVLMANLRRRWLGLFPFHRVEPLGHLGPIVGRILSHALQNGAPFRVRVVSLTPEHLARAHGPEVYVSIWADPSRLR
jgi:hypothetical protein